jgi:hypothetical protein
MGSGKRGKRSQRRPAHESQRLVMGVVDVVEKKALQPDVGFGEV